MKEYSKWQALEVWAMMVAYGRPRRAIPTLADAAAVGIDEAIVIRNHLEEFFESVGGAFRKLAVEGVAKGRSAKERDGSYSVPVIPSVCDPGESRRAAMLRWGWILLAVIEDDARLVELVWRRFIEAYSMWIEANPLPNMQYVAHESAGLPRPSHATQEALKLRFLALDQANRCNVCKRPLREGEWCNCPGFVSPKKSKKNRSRKSKGRKREAA